jgi:hypothetical protein
MIVPPLLRQAAKVIALQKFGPEDLEETRQKHPE